MLITDQAGNESHVNSWAVFKLTKLFSEVVFYKKTLMAILELIWKLRRVPKAKQKKMLTQNSEMCLRIKIQKLQWRNFGNKALNILDMKVCK